MAAKKYYGVKKGKVTGVFNNWPDCRASVDGYPGAEYKGFSCLEEAKQYLGSQYCLHFSDAEEKSRLLEQTDGHQACLPKEGFLLAYVDGSYDDSLKKYAFGCVFLLPDGRIFTSFGNGDSEQSLKHRNVTGEMLGAMYAVKCAMRSHFLGVEIRYDYEGIEKWVTGAWRAKTELTGKYAASMREWGKGIEIRFAKVPAHSGVYYNELADKMAKTGLTAGDGIPEICRIEEMEEYHGTDQTE